MFVAAAAGVSGLTTTTGGSITLRNVAFVQPMHLREDDERLVQTVIECQSATNIYAATARIASCRVPSSSSSASSTPQWVTHATCKILTPMASASPILSSDTIRALVPAENDGGDAALRLYQEFAEAGFGYGPSFAAVTGVWQLGDETAVARVEPDIKTKVDPESQMYVVHPALLDACSQIASLVHPASFGGVPASIAEVIFFSIALSFRLCHFHVDFLNHFSYY